MSVVQPIDYAAIAAPLGAALLALAVLVADLFLPAARKPALVWVAVAGSLAGVGWTVLLALQGQTRATFCVDAERCSYVAEPWTAVLQAVVLAGTAVVLLLSMPVLRDARIPPGEWCFLLLCSSSGALVLAASRDFVTLVVALEVVSLPLFALAGLRRYDGRSSEAALKLFLVSVVSAAVMLFGVSLVYAARGTLFLAGPAGRSPVSPEDTATVATAGLALVLAGFAFKVSAVPFHAWAPDTYAGAPLPAAAYLSVVSKAAGFAGLLVVLVRGEVADPADWAPVVAVVAALTMTLGNLVALRQRSAVRLVAWSSVAQAGYMLAPLAAADRIGPPAAAAATTAYVCAYAAMNLAAFASVIAVGRDRPRNALDDYRGLARTSPWNAAVLAFALACLAGLPPGIVGLFAKVVVFRAVVDGGVAWLAVVMALNTVVALYYYLAWAALLFARPEGDPALPAVRRLSPPLAAAAGLATAVAVVWSVAPDLMLRLGDLVIQ